MQKLIWIAGDYFADQRDTTREGKMRYRGMWTRPSDLAAIAMRKLDSPRRQFPASPDTIPGRQ